MPRGKLPSKERERVRREGKSWKKVQGTSRPFSRQARQKVRCVQVPSLWRGRMSRQGLKKPTSMQSFCT